MESWATKFYLGLKVIFQIKIKKKKKELIWVYTKG